MPKLKDPNVWFQNALVEAINRDPVDAAGDAEVLCRILKLRAAAVQKGPERSGALGCSSQHDLAHSLGRAVMSTARCRSMRTRRPRSLGCMRPVMLSADSIKWSSPQRRAPLGQLISITNFAGDKRDVAVSHR